MMPRSPWRMIPARKIMNLYASLQEQYESGGGYSWESELRSVFTRFGFTEDDLGRKVNEFSGGQKTRLAFVKLLLSQPDILLLDEPTNHLDIATIEWLENLHQPLSQGCGRRLA